MKNAKELLEEFTAASFRDPKEAAEMFTEDGAFEMPYLESLGVPGRYEGREAIEGFFRFVRDVYPDMDLENVKVMIDTPEQAFAEYEFTAQSSKTGRTIHELFFGRLIAENGRSSFFANQSISLRLPSASSRMGSPTTRFHRSHPQTQHNKHASTFKSRIRRSRTGIPGNRGKQR